MIGFHDEEEMTMRYFVSLAMSLALALILPILGCQHYGSHEDEQIGDEPLYEEPAPPDDRSDGDRDMVQEDPSPDRDHRDGGRPDGGHMDGGHQDGGRPDGGRPDGGPVDGGTECTKTFIGALADCAFRYARPDWVSPCPSPFCEGGPCQSDAECLYTERPDPGPLCVTGNCVYCWQDEQCPIGQLCRTGRCVEPVVGCPPTACSGTRCRPVSTSELPCPVCVCESIFNVACQRDMDCQVLSSYPYKHCLYGRCAECKDDSECGWGACLPPGLCFPMNPHPSALYGTWLIGWSGGLDHFSYFRFEPDGTLRRGSYQASGSFADDIPPLPCTPAGGLPSPLVGTWEPEVTESGFLIVRASLKLSCDTGTGLIGRFSFSLAADGRSATITWLESGIALTGFKRAAGVCSDDFSSCPTPDLSAP
jgi:hypothetical protein